MNSIGNDYNRGATHLGRFVDNVREARVRWCGHVQRRNMGCIGRQMLRI